MCQNNHQYKVGGKILVKRKKNYKHELEFIGSFPITQINDNGTVRSQKVIINDYLFEANCAIVMDPWILTRA